MVWAQRADKVILTVKLEGCNEKDTTIEIKEQSVYFKGKGGTNKTDHEVLMELNKEIDTEVCDKCVCERHGVRMFN